MSSMLDEVVEGIEPASAIVSAMTSMNPAFLLSLDIGTSGVRAGLFDDQGNELSGTRVNRSRLAFHNDFGELDADKIVEYVIEAIDELFANSVFHPERIE